MSEWVDLKAVWEIIVVGLLAGAGLPAVFALGIRALASPGRDRETAGDQLAGGGVTGRTIAVLCFAIVLAGIGYGIYIIVATGHK